MENEELNISKIKNIYIMLLTAIAEDNIDRVDHFLDDTLANRYREIVNNNINKNVKQKFEMLNITNVSIINETKDTLVVNAKTRYVNYKVNRKNNSLVEGNNISRQTYSVILKFRKTNVKSQIAYECPGCGASLNLNEKSICEHCGRPIDERYSPLVLTEINGDGIL